MSSQGAERSRRPHRRRPSARQRTAATQLLAADAGKDTGSRPQTVLNPPVLRSVARQRSLEYDREIRDLLGLLDDGWMPPDLRLRIRIACRRSAETETE